MKYLSYRLSPAMWARVLLLWIVLAIGALVLGIFTLWLGQFVASNVNDELESQQITFPSEESMDEATRAIDGMVDYAGEQLSNGDQARVYSEYIGLHLEESAERAGYPGETYATLGSIQRALRSEVSAAEEAGDEELLAEKQAELSTVDNLRDTMLTGSNLRAILLNAYGWGNVATGVTVAGAIIVVLAFGFFALFFFELRRGHLPAPATAAAATES